MSATRAPSEPRHDSEGALDDHRLDQRPLLIAQVGFVGLALPHGDQPNIPIAAARPECRTATRAVAELIEAELSAGDGVQRLDPHAAEDEKSQRRGAF